jgi:hypothetical protein
LALPYGDGQGEIVWRGHEPMIAPARSQDGVAISGAPTSIDGPAERGPPPMQEHEATL